MALEPTTTAPNAIVDGVISIRPLRRERRVDRDPESEEAAVARPDVDPVGVDTRAGELRGLSDRRAEPERERSVDRYRVVRAQLRAVA